MRVMYVASEATPFIKSGGLADVIGSLPKETAKKVGYRKKGNLLIIKIKSKEAFENDIKFYKEENGVWLCDEWLLLIAKNFNLRFLNFIKCSINRYFIKL